ncbi:putative family c-likeg-protein-coupled receptor protein [Podospora aff. communis PSN243]|uniref:Family c-likeg-protein-coupled receptor protein n=1 Tax=Podospora aff. communis PSN243 TaxID=3040156 RepID=A0AAV9GWJ9_9PEZI|nr:putative family c-likeg-protein-coupled receptor protein [Podospora aff. communis PSN243]
MACVLPLLPPLHHHHDTNTPQPPPGPPYLPQWAQSGVKPTPLPDDPISAVLLALFVGSAVMHMATFQLNRRRSHRFFFSALLFGFSMARITALTMRIVFAHHHNNISVAIAAGVFTAAGVMLLFVVNLAFAQRMVRAYLPEVGWKRGVRLAFGFVYGSVGAMLVMVVAVTVHMFYTDDEDVRGREREVQLVAATYLAVLAFLPVPVVLGARWWAGRRDGGRLVRDKFGKGSFKAKMGLLMTTSLLLTLGAGFRAGVGFAPRPVWHLAWYHGKGPYYVFNFGIELVVVYMYGLARFDHRFHVPNGSKGPGDYAKGSGLSINNEEEVFGPAEGDDEGVDVKRDVEDVMVKGDSDDASSHAKHDSGIASADWDERYDAYMQKERDLESLERAKKSEENV